MSDTVLDVGAPLTDIDVVAPEHAIERTRQYLLSRRSEAGYRVGELEADASVTAGPSVACKMA